MVTSPAIAATAPPAEQTVIAAPTAIVPAQQAMHALEPELLAATPRRVAATAAGSATRVIAMNVITGCALLLWYVVQNSGAQGGAFGVRVALTILNMIAPYLLGAALFNGAHYLVQRQRLRHWQPVAATVTARTAKAYGSAPTVELRYRYEVVPGEYAEGTRVTNAATPLQPGDTFTLLQDPRRPRRVVPFADLTLARVTGAPAHRA